ncbi:SusD/RagB family nutrient-binding outer membrane lipoprotein [Galbibacter sp. PAP.153]|uniref:SusD/RagB family nutrient-binding outer membrane lipoprotein n=1 Tax=Galbibacter sp. PAP.153 TaxID=3104623 RepID=UPI00300828DC
MKNIKTYSILIIASLSWLGCSNFDDLNTNPNTSATIDPEIMLTTIEFLPGANWQDQTRYFYYPGGFMNQWTGLWGMVEYGGNAQKSAPEMSRLWLKYYPDVINKTITLIDATKDDPALVNINSMARIIKVQCFLRLTDYYGDIPYFDAGKGYLEDKLITQYDRQEDIYNDFFKELDEASKALDASKPLAKYDAIYDSNINEWKKYANSLRLRIAMRLVKVNPAKAKQEAETAVAAGVFTSNEDICAVTYEDFRNPSTGIGKGNGVANLIYGSSADRGSEFWLTTEIVEVMEAMNDPRLLNGYYATIQLRDENRTDVTDLVLNERGGPYAASTMQAQRYAWDPNSKYPGGPVTINYNGEEVAIEYRYSLLRASKYIQAFDAPFINIGYAEVEFLLAEAAFRGWNVPGSAAEHYKNGLEASVRQWRIFGAEVNESDVTAFSNANPLTPGQELMDINTQLWVLHILDPMEAWSNYRRSGMPEVTFHNYVPSLNQSNGQMPRRMEYPSQEAELNTSSYEEAVSRIGEDDWLKRVWWDVEQ